VQDLRGAEKRSDFDGRVLAYYGIRARGAKPAFEGISAKAERERADGLMHKEIKPTKAEAVKSMPAESQPKADARGDRSKEALESLSDYERKIFEEMPLDKAVSADYFAANGEILANAMFALTTLEIKGLVSSLPGALYIRK
jgi:hypothetical protein